MGMLDYDYKLYLKDLKRNCSAEQLTSHITFKLQGKKPKQNKKF